MMWDSFSFQLSSLHFLFLNTPYDHNLTASATQSVGFFLSTSSAGASSSTLPSSSSVCLVWFFWNNNLRTAPLVCPLCDTYWNFEMTKDIGLCVFLQLLPRWNCLFLLSCQKTVKSPELVFLRLQTPTGESCKVWRIFILRAAEWNVFLTKQPPFMMKPWHSLGKLEDCCPVAVFFLTRGSYYYFPDTCGFLWVRVKAKDLRHEAGKTVLPPLMLGLPCLCFSCYFGAAHEWGAGELWERRSLSKQRCYSSYDRSSQMG